MNDPASSPTRDQDASDGEFQEIFFSPATWKQGVEFYKELTEMSPNPAGPLTAVFKSKLGYEIRVTQTDNKNTLAEQAARITPMAPVLSSGLVTSIINMAAGWGAEVVIKPFTVEVYPILTREPTWRHITLGSVRFKTRQQFTSDDTTVGVIHNPNW